jgi:3-phosphoshikimate 1-carboxyvinyltransferase
MDRIIEPAAGPLRGSLSVPGDKSVSHRALMMAAMAHGTSRITGLLESEDVDATMSALRALGAEIDASADGTEREVVVTGWGERGPLKPGEPIYCGNSGTTVRLLAGIVAGWPLRVTFTGDESLSRRPMGRIATPLAMMGAVVETTRGTLPMTIEGGDLECIVYESPVASAQVKTSVLFAGLRASGRTRVREPARSRDHTERMLPEFGVPVDRSADLLGSAVKGPADLIACDVQVPADPSSAAFLAAATAIVPDSHVRLEGLMLNPTRTAALEVLRRFGAQLAIDHQGISAGEEIGAVTVTSPAMRSAFTVSAADVPSLIDEIPALAVVATQGLGTSRFEGVGELRVKESDRLTAIVDALSALGASVRAGEDWLEVEGPASLSGGVTLQSLGDHRLAMAYHVAGLVADSALTIEGYEATAVSYPGFAEDLASLFGGGASR